MEMQCSDLKRAVCDRGGKVSVEFVEPGLSLLHDGAVVL